MSSEKPLTQEEWFQLRNGCKACIDAYKKEYEDSIYKRTKILEDLHSGNAMYSRSLKELFLAHCQQIDTHLLCEAAIKNADIFINKFYK